MSTPNPAGWFQQVLVPPDRVHLRLDLYIIGQADSIGVTATLWDGADETMAGMLSRHWAFPMLASGDLDQWLSQVLHAAVTRTCPF